MIQENEDTPFIVNVDAGASINVNGILEKLIDKSIFNYPATSYGRLSMMDPKMYMHSFMYHGLAKLISYAPNDGTWFDLAYNNPSWGESGEINQHMTTFFHDEFDFLQKEGLIRFTTVQVSTLRDIFHTKL